MPTYNINMQLTLQSPTTQNLGKIRNDVQKALSGIGFTIDTKNLRAAATNIDDLTKAQKKALSTADNFAEAVALKGVNFASYAIATNAVKNLGLYIASAVTEAIRFEKELSVLAQTVNISVDSAKEYSNEILNISKNYGLAQTKTAELVRVLAQAGLSLKESLKAAESLAKTTLVGTFDNLNKTTEAFIALMSAFNLSVNDATKALETINVVSKAFAVESNDIVDAITRAGGAFKAAGGNVEELIALFTSVRSYSRESSETIATGFRAILGRLQRAETVNFFKKRGIELRRLNGEFVGGFEAIKRITEGLEQAGIKSGDVEFANVVEQIGGIYQLSRVVALLDNFKEAQRAMQIANKASAESDIDAAKAKEALAFKIDELRANFSALITEITQTATFKILTTGLLEVTDLVLSLTRAVKGLLPLLAAFAAVKVVGSLGSLIASGLKRLPKRGSGSGAVGYASGGIVPGDGNGDTVPAMLTPGEFVINKKSAEQFGYNNLKRINRYAKGGIVSKVQKFADGGIVAGMSDANLSIDTGLLQSLNFVGDKLGPLANSFSLLTLQMRLAINFTEFFAQKIKAFGESSAEQAKKTEEITRQLDEARKELTQTRREIKKSVFEKKGEIDAYKNMLPTIEASKSLKSITAKDLIKNLSTNVSTIISDTTKDMEKQKSDLVGRNIVNAISGRKAEVWNPGDAKDQEQLKSLISELQTKYRGNTKILSAINDIQKSLPGEIKSQIKAVSDFSNILEQSTLEQEYLIIENRKIVKEKKEELKNLKTARKDDVALMVSNIKGLEGALPKKTSFFSKVGGFAKTAVSSFGPEVASLALAAFTSSLDKASQNALTLSEELQKAGDAAGAEKAARTAAQEEMKSGNIQFYSTVGASIGAVFGPLGLAVGAASGALFGFVNSITNFTDFLGLTSYQDQIDAKAMEATKNAQISSAEKQVAIAKESFDKFGRTDPSKSLDQLEQSISKYINIFEKSREISLGKDKGLETSQVAFKDFMDMFSSLAKSAEFAGMSFDEISKKNPKIADGLNRIAVATGNTDWLKSFITEFNVLQNVLKAEAASKASLVEAQIRSVKLQRGINEATEKWSKTLTIQSRSLRSINFSKSGFSYLEKVDLSNFELDNTKSQNFKNALDSVSQAFPGLSETVKSFQNEINAFDIAKFELASRLPAINLGTNQNAVQAQRAELAEQVMAIFEGMNLGDLEENIRSQILGGEDPTELLNKILSDKANALQKPLDLITNVFNNYAEVLKNRVEFEAKQLDQSISIQKAQQSNNKMIADIIADIFGENPIAEYQTALQNRLSNVSKALEGTSLSKMNLSGGKRDIDIIGNAISQNKAKQIEIDAFIATGKTIDEFGNTTTDLMNELSSLQTEANAFKVALEELGNTSQETSAAQKALQKSISDRAKLREVAGDLAFGTRESRSEFLKKMQQARILSFTGNIGNIRESDRQSLKAFLTEFKDLPVFNGLKGDAIIRGVTENFLLSTGSSPEEVKLIMGAMLPVEEQMLEQLKTDSQTQIDQLKVLRNIEAQSFNAANMNGGGSVFKPRGSDTVPAMLTPGEFVMSKSAVGKIGRANLERMNSTGTIYASDGGIIEVAGVKYDKRTDYFRNRYKSDVAFKQGVDLVESINLSKRRKIGYAKNLGIDTANLDLNDPRLAFDQNLVNDTISSIGQKTGETRSLQQELSFSQGIGRGSGNINSIPSALVYAAKTVKNVASGYSINQSDELLMQEIFGAPEKLSQKLIDDTINEISASRKGLNVRPLSEAEIFAIKQKFQYTGSPTSTAKQVKQEVVQPKEFDTKSNISGALNAYGAMAKSFLNPDQRSMEQRVEEVFRKKREEERSKKYAKMSTQLEAALSPRMSLYKPKPEDYLNAAKRAGSFLSTAIPQAYEAVKQQSQKAASPTPIVQPSQNVRPEQNVQPMQPTQAEPSKLDRIAERLKTEKNPNVRRQLMIGYQYQQRKQQLIDRSNSMYGISQARKAERDKKEAIKREFDRKRGAESLSKMSANPYYKGTKAYAARISAEKDAREKAYDANKIKDIQEYNLPQLSTNTSDETVNNLNKIIQKGNEQKIKEADELVKSYGYGSKNFDPIKMKEAIRNRRKMIESFREKPQGRSPQSIFGRMKENKNREDIVPAMLTPGEFVLKKSAVRDIGLPALNNMNKSKVKGFANGGLVGGGSTGGFNGGGSNSNDYSVLTQSLIDFNSRFSESVRQLIEMPKVFEISLQNVGVNVNLNGAEFLAKLPDVLKSIVLENIQSEIGNITSQVKKNLSSGN